MQHVYNELTEKSVGKVLIDEPFKKHTTIKIGGPADLFIRPKSIDSLKDALAILKKHDLPIRVIGRGSNLLTPDEGIRGAVIQFGKGLDHLEVLDDQIRVGGGYPLVRLAAMISRESLSGLEFAAGIPGSVGGAVFMNAGAHGSDISKILVKAHILFEDGTTEWLTNEQMQFDYRKSVLQDERKGYCIEAVFQLARGDKKAVLKEMKKHKEYRRETQPWDYPCAGSIFRNPLPNHAGQLVEELGLKGHRIGGAKISDMHGNFIVNEGDASYHDVIVLIELIKEQVKAEYQIEMMTEVEILS
ncbi:UDP-N-acetylmuramate dehydrogenase [Tenuibacillus multivorans]|uniref:UDP-N-acetylenolpyruvoylglucosamine reductase n=1 Tax=Tenuibacillus multivorans TaxID=237069 RepID=A0A1G9Y6C1_9BACI|nr:UDP-N-acetylmuramate dehydrogenase [Tenuibacillus multivorans]GEL75965.1 UDP-N-acetylenolpyruvoylglucosamine reductase [Tenuibacillus multivorans]SDN04597.1 UDP-N-acetylmuramate dehydrogenase [Tenuibacillus multivorans]